MLKNGSGTTIANIGFVNNIAPSAKAKITFDVGPAPIKRNLDIFFALLNCSSSGSTKPANIAMNMANPPVLIPIFSKTPTIPCAPS